MDNQFDTVTRMWNDLRGTQSVDTTQFKTKKEVVDYVSERNEQYGLYFRRTPHILGILQADYKEYFNTDKSSYKGKTEYLRRKTTSIRNKNLYVKETKTKYKLYSSRGKHLKDIDKKGD